MRALETIVKERIGAKGPISVAEFMDMALCHPEHGYYMGRDPFGRGGDFVTAPEISQMFGELIGAWAADVWIRLGQPSSFQLIECGPGRGTLMADLLRATRDVPGFHEAMDLILIEASPSLTAKQQEMLSDYDVRWCGSFDDPVIQDCEAPMILIANEFLDVLPIHQFLKTDKGWRERTIDLKDDGDLDFAIRPLDEEIALLLPDLPEGAIYENSPASVGFIGALSPCLVKRQGAAIIIDYGYIVGTDGTDTLQAVKNHEYVPVLFHIGEADLTAHVDFKAMAVAAKAAGACVYGPVTQGQFLETLGISRRAEKLKEAADAKQKEDIDLALKRLVSSDQMGELFKVFIIGAGI